MFGANARIGPDNGFRMSRVDAGERLAYNWGYGSATSSLRLVGHQDHVVAGCDSLECLAQIGQLRAIEEIDARLVLASGLGVDQLRVGESGYTGRTYHQLRTDTAGVE